MIPTNFSLPRLAEPPAAVWPPQLPPDTARKDPCPARRHSSPPPQVAAMIRRATPPPPHPPDHPPPSRGRRLVFPPHPNHAAAARPAEDVGIVRPAGDDRRSSQQLASLCGGLDSGRAVFLQQRDKLRRELQRHRRKADLLAAESRCDALREQRNAAAAVEAGEESARCTLQGSEAWEYAACVRELALEVRGALWRRRADLCSSEATARRRVADAEAADRSPIRSRPRAALLMAEEAACRYQCCAAEVAARADAAASVRLTCLSEAASVAQRAVRVSLAQGQAALQRAAAALRRCCDLESAVRESIRSDCHDAEAALRRGRLCGAAAAVRAALSAEEGERRAEGIGPLFRLCGAEMLQRARLAGDEAAPRFAVAAGVEAVRRAELTVAELAERASASWRYALDHCVRRSGPTAAAAAARRLQRFFLAAVSGQLRSERRQWLAEALRDAPRRRIPPAAAARARLGAARRVRHAYERELQDWLDVRVAEALSTAAADEDAQRRRLGRDEGTERSMLRTVYGARRTEIVVADRASLRGACAAGQAALAGAASAAAAGWEAERSELDARHALQLSATAGTRALFTDAATAATALRRVTAVATIQRTFRRMLARRVRHELQQRRRGSIERRVTEEQHAEGLWGLLDCVWSEETNGRSVLLFQHDAGLRAVRGQRAVDRELLLLAVIQRRTAERAAALASETDRRVLLQLSESADREAVARQAASTAPPTGRREPAPTYVMPPMLPSPAPSHAPAAKIQRWWGALRSGREGRQARRDRLRRDLTDLRLRRRREAVDRAASKARADLAAAAESAADAAAVEMRSVERDEVRSRAAVAAEAAWIVERTRCSALDELDAAVHRRLRLYAEEEIDGRALLLSTEHLSRVTVSADFRGGDVGSALAQLLAARALQRLVRGGAGRLAAAAARCWATKMRQCEGLEQEERGAVRAEEAAAVAAAEERAAVAGAEAADRGPIRAAGIAAVASVCSPEESAWRRWLVWALVREQRRLSEALQNALRTSAAVSAAAHRLDAVRLSERGIRMEVEEEEMAGRAAIRADAANAVAARAAVRIQAAARGFLWRRLRYSEERRRSSERRRNLDGVAADAEPLHRQLQQLEEEHDRAALQQRCLRRAIELRRAEQLATVKQDEQAARLRADGSVSLQPYVRDFVLGGAVAVPALQRALEGRYGQLRRSSVEIAAAAEAVLAEIAGTPELALAALSLHKGALLAADEHAGRRHLLLAEQRSRVQSECDVSGRVVWATWLWGTTTLWGLCAMGTRGLLEEEESCRRADGLPVEAARMLGELSAVRVREATVREHYLEARERLGRQRVLEQMAADVHAFTAAAEASTRRALTASRATDEAGLRQAAWRQLRALHKEQRTRLEKEAEASGERVQQAERAAPVHVAVGPITAQGREINGRLDCWAEETAARGRLEHELLGVALPPPLPADPRARRAAALSDIVDWRRHVAEEKESRDRASVLLQCVWRGRFGRQLATGRRLLRFRVQNAMLAQRLWRRYTAMRASRRLRRLRAEQWEERDRRELLEHSAALFQAAWRMHWVRTHFEEVFDAEMA